MSPLPDDFHQLKLAFSDPVQHDYEAIRPIVLGAATISHRSEQTGIERTVLGDYARQFVQHGMRGLFDQRADRAGRSPHTFPSAVADYLRFVKTLYPPIRYRELVRIVAHKFGYHTNHHTVKRFLDQHPVATQLPLPWTRFHAFDDAYRARWTVVKLFYEGWQQQSIAGCLQLSERPVRRILDAFAEDGFAGLEDQRHRPPDHPATQLTLPFLKQVLEVQQAYPDAGKFRVQGLLEQQLEGKPPSLATIGRALARNRALHGAPGPSGPTPSAQKGAVKYLRYRPTYRHQYWFIDVRYLVQLDGAWVYSICVLEGYSRAILAGMISRYQDSIAVLQILRAALAAYGCPDGIVSDNGAVFTSQAYTQALETLAITACYIEQGKPWQNLIEAQFKVQARLADNAFVRAPTLDMLERVHTQFIETFNTTAHWAHQEREDGRRTPAAVLAWVQARMINPGVLDEAFRSYHLTRMVDARGYVSIQRFYLYAERGLARQRVTIWLYDGRLQVEHDHILLAQYSYRAEGRRLRLTAIEQPQVYQTRFASPQLELWELDDTQWRKVMRRQPRMRRQTPPRPAVEQLAFSLTGLVASLLIRWLDHAA